MGWTELRPRGGLDETKRPPITSTHSKCKLENLCNIAKRVYFPVRLTVIITKRLYPPVGLGENSPFALSASLEGKPRLTEVHSTAPQC